VAAGWKDQPGAPFCSSEGWWAEGGHAGHWHCSPARWALHSSRRLCVPWSQQRCPMFCLAARALHGPATGSAAVHRAWRATPARCCILLGRWRGWGPKGMVPQNTHVLGTEMSRGKRRDNDRQTSDSAHHTDPLLLAAPFYTHPSPRPQP